MGEKVLKIQPDTWKLQLVTFTCFASSSIYLIKIVVVISPVYSVVNRIELKWIDERWITNIAEAVLTVVFSLSLKFVFSITFSKNFGTLFSI